MHYVLIPVSLLPYIRMSVSGPFHVSWGNYALRAWTALSGGLAILCRKTPTKIMAAAGCRAGIRLP